MIAHTNEPLAQRSHNTGWKFLQQIFDSHYIHNKAFNAERDHTDVSDKDDDDIDFNRDDHQGFLQTAKQRIKNARQRMSPVEFRYTMRLNPVERFKRIQSASDDESQNYTGFDSLTIKNSDSTPEPSDNSTVHNNQDKIEQTKSSLPTKQDHIPPQIDPLHYDNDNSSDTKNTDDKIIPQISATPPALREKANDKVIPQTSATPPTWREKTDDKVIQQTSATPPSLSKNTHPEDKSFLSTVGDGVNYAISSAADAAKSSVQATGVLGALYAFKAADSLKSTVGYAGGSDSIKDGIDTVGNIAAGTSIYTGHVASRVINAGEVSTQEGPGAGYRQLKEDLTGDIPRLRTETLDWVKTNKDTIMQAQEAFGVNLLGKKNMNDEMLLSTVLAISEEFNRKGNPANRLIDWAQDGIVSSYGRVVDMGDLSPNIGAGNINLPTAEKLATRLNDLPNPNHPDMKELKRKVLGSEAELSRYILTAKGTAMVGGAIMYLIKKDIKNDHFFAEYQANKNEFNVDKIQNLVDIWREGPTRIDRMRGNQQKAKKNNQAYEPMPKHFGLNISDKNATDIKYIVYPNTNEYFQIE